MTADTARQPTAAVSAPARRRPRVPPHVLALAAVLLAGAYCLPMPFWGDQALFAVYGRQVADGAVLYRDLLDLKQPGIFAFYAAAGSLFGFTEIGIHAFELAYWLAFSAFALVALRPYLATRWAPPLVPVFTVAVYYLQAQMVDLTQIEILAAFPLLVVWWLVDRAEFGTRKGARLYATAGAVAAAVVLLKHVYLLIALAFVGYAVLRARQRRIASRDLVRSLAAFTIGLLLPLLVAAAYFAAHGQLERMWWAFFEWSPRARFIDPQPLSNLTGGARRFMVGHAPLLVLAAAGAAHALRQRTRPQLDLVAAMLLWGAAGAVAVLVQFWGEWHWFLFTVPVGILAVVGLEALVALVRQLHVRPGFAVIGSGGALGVLAFFVAARGTATQKWLLLPVAVGLCAGIAAVWAAARPRLRRHALHLLIGIVVFALGLAAIAPVGKLRALVEQDLALTAEARRDLQESWNPAYAAAREDLDVLRSGDVRPGPWYVFGDPVLLHQADRRQAVPIHGWGPEKLDARAWRELHRDLRATLPPYIVINEFSASVIRDRHPAVLDFVASHYEIAFVGASGTWYERR